MSVRHVVRPAVLRDVPTDRHAVIEASAGTGKTFTLEHLVVELLLTTDATFDKLLVVTFTEKATNELRTRLRAKLEEILSGGGDPPTEDQVRSGDCWRIDEPARAKLSRALHTFDGAMIATIHAFCQRVLHDNAFASGRLFEEQQVDGREAFARALRDALRRDIARDETRSRWLEAALRTGWSIGRIEELLWRCEQAHADLRPDFDAATLDSAIHAFPVEDAIHPHLAEEMKAWGTHHATCKSIARLFFDIVEAIEPARLTRDPTRYVLRADRIDFGKLAKLPPAATWSGRAARVCTAARALARATPSFKAALAHALSSGVRHELARSKREGGRYDFDDMLMLVAEALGKRSGGALRDAIRGRWRYALIDEFQDTDAAQWSIFRRAFFEPATDGGRPCVLYLVGDPKQSIYRFRGADVNTYLQARDEIVSAGGELVRLVRNYRATPALVDATNAMFDQQAADPLFGGPITYAPVTSGRPRRALLDGWGRPMSAMAIFRFAGEPSLPRLGARIAREIGTIADATHPWRLDGRPLEHRDVFVLTRNAREGREIGAALRAAGIPHAFYKEEGLLQTQEAREVRVLFGAIDDPTDRAGRVAAWLTPFFGLSLADIERGRDLPASHPLIARLHTWKALADARDFDLLFESIVRDSGIVRREIFFADGERELTNYLHVLEILLERARASHITLRELTSELSGLIARRRLPLDLEGNVQRLESERSAVQIMTIHKSKGLEAAIVFVAGGISAAPGDDVRVYHEGALRLAWVGALAPEVKPVVEREERDEEQRLMYVALTRAMGRLYLPCFVGDSGNAKRPGTVGEARSLRGPYNRVNRRIAELVRTSADILSVEDQAENEAAPEKKDCSRRGDWRPAMALLRQDDTGGVYASLRDRNAGAFVTSYTRIKGEGARTGARSAWALDLDERRTRQASDVGDEAPRTTLRAARTSGVFLHELLECVSLASFASPGGFDAWRRRGDVATLVDEALAVHRVEPTQRDHAERLVWAAYTTEVPLPGGDAVPGLAAALHVVREMEFVFPMPEDEQPAAAEAPVDRRPVEPKRGRFSRDARGYVRGSLDLAFSHRGLTYFVDWKSDSLPSYAPDDLDPHVGVHYAQQVELYSLAVVRLLGVRTRAEHEGRFGGVLFCFLRGFDSRGHGLWSARPSWDDVLAWEDALRARGRRGARGPRR